jgi:polar amino acid transport system permease protein
LLLLLTAAGVAATAAWVAGSIAPQEFLDYLPRLWSGLGITLFLAGSSFLGGLAAAFLLLWLSHQGKAAAKAIAVYQDIIRFTPLLAQLYLVYYGAGEIAPALERLGLWWIFKEPLSCVLLVFVINSTAYQSYILINCVRNVPKGQLEAGQVIGLSPHVLMLKVLLPQALRFSVRPLGNELVGVIKASSLASVVTVFDLLGETQAIYADTFNLAYFVVAAAVYVVLVEATRIGIDRFSPPPATSR